MANVIECPMQAGFYPDVPFADYLKWPLLSQSVLKQGSKSMAHLKAALDEEIKKEPTDEMILGSALHTTFLEPELAAMRIALWTGGTRRGEKWDAFEIENAGKYILTENMHEKLVGMVRALRRHKVIREWAGRIEHVEYSGIAQVHGVMMKGRIDALTPDPLFDLKKVVSGDPFLFRKTAWSFGYHIQAFVYRRIFNRDRFILATVEENPPYDVLAYELTDTLSARGEREAMALLQRVQWCQKNKVWPGRSDDIMPLDVPAFAQDEVTTVADFFSS